MYIGLRSSEIYNIGTYRVVYRSVIFFVLNMIFVFKKFRSAKMVLFQK